MKSMRSAVVLSLLSFGFVSGVLAQQTIGPDAGYKIRGDFNSAASHQYYAQQQARVMYYTQQITPAAPAEVVKKQAETVKGALAKADEQLKSVKEAHSKDPEVVKLVDTILKHHAAATAHCNMAGECAVKGEGAHVVANCCADMHDELEAANKHLLTLKKHLKVEDLPVPKKVTVPPKK